MPNVSDYVPNEATYFHHADSTTVSGTSVVVNQVWAKKVGGQRFHIEDVDPNFDGGKGRVFLRSVSGKQGIVVTPMTKLLTDYTLGT